MRLSYNLENKITLHILNSPAKMFENSSQLFFRTTTRIQLRSDSFDKLKLVMTFLISLEVTELYSFRLVLEGKSGKEMSELSRLEFLENFLTLTFLIVVGGKLRFYQNLPPISINYVP